MKNKKLLILLAFIGLSMPAAYANFIKFAEFRKINSNFKADSLVGPGDTFTMFKMVATSGSSYSQQGFDTTMLSQLFLTFENSGIDSIYLYEGNELVGKARVYASSYGYEANMYLSRLVLVSYYGSIGTLFNVVCKVSSSIKNVGNLLSPHPGNRRCVAKSSLASGNPDHIRDLFAWPWYTKIKIPTVSTKLVVQKMNTLAKSFCVGDYVLIHNNLVGKEYVTSEEFSLNNTITDRQTISKILLSGSLLKIKVCIKDSFGRIVKDSVIINIVPRVVGSIITPSGKFSFCGNDGISLRFSNHYVDSVNWILPQRPGVIRRSYLQTEGDGIYKIRAYLNGCLVNDSVLIQGYPFPEKPIIQKDDSILFSLNNKFNDSLVWRNMDVSIPEENKRFFKPKNSGYYSLRVYNEYGCMEESDLLIYSIKQKTTSIGNIAGKQFNVYPNPATDQFTIESNLEKGQAELIDMQGRVVRTFTVERGSNTIQREGLASGMYYIRYAGSAIKFVFQ